MPAGAPAAPGPLPPAPGRGWRRLLAATIVIPVIVFVLAAWYDYGAVYREGRREVVTTADALGEHAQTVMQTAELVVARVTDRLDGMNWDQIDHSRALHDFLAEMQHELPQLESVFLVDSEGFNSASSRAFPMQRFDVRQREYYLAAQRSPRQFFVSAPFRGQMAGTLAFTVSRARITDGHFDGVVAVTISPEYFERFYRSVIRFPGRSSAALVRSDGAMLLRYPEIPNLPERLPANSLLLRAAAGGQTQGFFAGPSAIEGRDRLGAFERVEGEPVLATFAMDRELVLQEWYRHLAVLATFTLLASLTLLLMTRMAFRHAEQERASLRHLLEETSRRQRAESALQQVQKMEALSRLSGGLAHDFNNLLTAILGSVELLGRQLSDPRARKLLDVVGQAAQRGARLTAQMLAFARRQNLSLRPVDANASIRGMQDMLRRTIDPLIRISYELEDGLWPALGDPVQLEVAVLNLAINARDALPLGGEIRIATRNIPADSPELPPLGLAPGAHVRISVTDDGQGMPEEVQQRAFEPFFTTKGPDHGTGLGLSMVYGFARQAGGTAAIQSEPGQGTTVSLYLPRAPANGPTPSDAAPPRGASVPPRRVLLVDDDEFVRITTRQMLQSLGHTVAEAEDGAAALDRLRRGEEFDLLLADFAMPAMNGAELARAARLILPALPILFMTGYAEGDTLSGIGDLGCPRLNKPFTSAELAAAVAEAVVDRPAPAGAAGNN